MKTWMVSCSALLFGAGPAWAGETPVYKPVPLWVVPAPPVDSIKTSGEPPVVVILDTQQRLGDGTVADYRDTAMRVASAELLDKIGTVTVSWIPDKGDLILHRVEIIRGPEHLDQLKAGERFTVLRREAGLERRELNGVLTATMPVKGLRIGDILRVSFTTTQSDAALKGHVQAVAPVLPEPFRAGFARARLSWPEKSEIVWKTFLTGADPQLETIGGFRTLTVMMPVAKQPEVPDDAPARFAHPPLLEATDFAGWQDVSKTMAPLFATDGLIVPGSALAKEVDRIKAEQATPVARAAAALRVVQDKISYLLLGMNGGNYVPQPPAETWTLRYGDCKAKTLLLLAMLHRMGIEAEPALASIQANGLLPVQLAAPGAFDHVLVRATIDGKTLWLDGTQSGTRLPDIYDTPMLRYVLPLRSTGASLMPIAMKPDARPSLSVTTDYDQTAGIDLPTVIKTVISVRGGPAAAMQTGYSQANAETRRDMAQSMVNTVFNQPLLGESEFKYDPETAIATVTATGLITTPWGRDGQTAEQGIDNGIEGIEFAPDRARMAWHDIPVVTGGLTSMASRARYHLPEAGKGYVLEGDRSIDGSLGGALVSRKAGITGDVVEAEERIDRLGAEIAPDAIAVTRARLAGAQTRLLKIKAPKNAERRWDGPIKGHDDPRYAVLEKIYSQAIIADPDEIYGYDSRASFRAGIFDRKGAIEDLTHAIAIAPAIPLYLRRAGLYEDLGNMKSALADAKTALALDPSSPAATLQIARYEERSGDAAAALSLLQERIDAGGKDRYDYTIAKSQILADSGRAEQALAMVDTAIAEKPGNPQLLNQRCWLKGTHNISAETALKDCTKAIELSDNPASMLDSRAMAYFRLGRSEDALTDLDAALDENPALPESLFMRAVIRQKLGQNAAAAADLKFARLLSPMVDRDYKVWGISAN